MEINTRNLTKGKLNATERINFELLYELISQLEAEPEFSKTIGAHLMTTKEGTNLHISAFSPDHLSKFVTRVMAGISEAKLNIGFSKENIENLWSPTWTSVITLDRG